MANMTKEQAAQIEKILEATLRKAGYRPTGEVERFDDEVVVYAHRYIDSLPRKAERKAERLFPDCYTMGSVLNGNGLSISIR